LVWHVVKQYAAKLGFTGPAPHDLRRCAIRPEENWSRFSFCLDTYLFKQPNGISAVNSGSARP
jgi:hypothetical protein